MEITDCTRKDACSSWFHLRHEEYNENVFFSRLYQITVHLKCQTYLFLYYAFVTELSKFVNLPLACIIFYIQRLNALFYIYCQPITVKFLFKNSGSWKFENYEIPLLRQPRYQTCVPNICLIESLNYIRLHLYFIVKVRYLLIDIFVSYLLTRKMNYHLWYPGKLKICSLPLVLHILL